MHTGARVTADELWEREGAGHSELIRGEIVMITPSGGLHGEVAATLAYFLRAHVAPQRRGKVLGAETGFLITRDPDTVRAPDVAFVSAERVPPGGSPEKYWPFAPDLAVEVVSPGDRWVEVDEKVQMWLAAGTRLVWVVDPRGRTVQVHRPGVGVVRLSEGDSLTGHDVLPEFALLVSQVFE